MKKKMIGYVVPHGHMDIEWYQPLHSYRFWTIEALDELIRISKDHPQYKTYVLDGQTCVLEIYLQARPSAKAKVQALIDKGTLSIGPFYSQFDEWLISAESMVRNCLYGNRACREYGSIMKAGYLPDNFGHPLQLPQILNEFGIDSLLFMRGMPEIPGGHPDEFMYTGLDGSRVLISHFRSSYGGAYNLFERQGVHALQPRDMPYHNGYFSYEQFMELADHVDQKKIAQDLISNVLKNKDRFPSGVVPLIAGSDHFPPQAKLGETIALANSLQDEIEFLMGNAEDYVRAVQANLKNPMEYKEELIGSFYQYVLLGALSTRTYLKRINFGAEVLMERYAEPLDALATLMGQYQDAQPQLDEAWKLLMVNSAHDSIHGSSVDETHVEMQGRFSAAIQVAVGLSHEALKHVGKYMEPWWKEGDEGILTFAPASTNGLQMGRVWLPIGDAEISILDQIGNSLQTQILPRETIELNSHGLPRNAQWPADSFREVLFLAPSCANEINSYVLKKGKSSTYKSIGATDTSLENEYIQVKVRGATIDILDKRTGSWTYGLNLIEEDADAGDAWDYSPTSDPSETVLSNQFPFSSRLVEQGSVRAALEIAGTMSVPYQLIGDTRSPKRVEIPMCFRVTLEATSPRVDVKLTFENTAKDHRLRLRVPSGIVTDSVLSQGAFGVLDRPIQRALEVEKWFQPPTQLVPFREWLAVQDGTKGLAIAAKGIYDYTAIVNPLNRKPDLYLTLLRGIELMGRLNTTQRAGECSPSQHTPGAQCPGLQEIEWSYIPYSIESNNSTPFIGSAQTFLYPMMTHMVRAEQRVAKLGKEYHPFSWTESNLQFSAFKRTFDGHSYVLRFFENHGKPTKAQIRMKGFSRVFQSNMNEEKGAPLSLSPNGVVEVTAEPFKVITLLLEK